jgi:membrane protein implicated in regulation of membrane protease activity
MLVGVLYGYVAAAVVGFVLLVASLAGAGHGHAIGHDAGEHPSPASALFSVRVWTYVLAFGGVTGAALRIGFRGGEPASAIAAAAVGMAAGAMAHVVIGRATRPGRSGTVRPADLVGRSARVVIPMAAGATGKVRVRVAGAEVDLLATADGAESLGRHDEVLIVEVGPEGTAVVTRNPSSN